MQPDYRLQPDYIGLQRTVVVRAHPAVRIEAAEDLVRVRVRVRARVRVRVRVMV